MRSLLESLQLRADLAADRHIGFADTLFGVRDRQYGSPLTLTPASIGELREELKTAALRYLDLEWDRLEVDLEWIAERGFRDALSHLGVELPPDPEVSLSELLTRSVSVPVELAYSELVAQVERDVNQMIRQYRALALQVDMVRAILGIPRQEAVVQVLITDRNNRQKLWFKDRAGRRVPSQKFIRQMWRQALRDLYLDVYLLTLADHGKRDFVIWHPERTHHAYGLTVSIDGAGNRLEDLEDVFHPNAQALPMTQKRFLEIDA